MLIEVVALHPQDAERAQEGGARPAPGLRLGDGEPHVDRAGRRQRDRPRHRPAGPRHAPAVATASPPRAASSPGWWAGGDYLALGVEGFVVRLPHPRPRDRRRACARAGRRARWVRPGRSTAPSTTPSTCARVLAPARRLPGLDGVHTAGRALGLDAGFDDLRRARAGLAGLRGARSIAAGGVRRRARAVAGPRRDHPRPPRRVGPAGRLVGQVACRRRASSARGGCCSTTTAPARPPDRTQARTERVGDLHRPTGLACARPALVAPGQRHLARRAARVRRRPRHPAARLRARPLRRTRRTLRRPGRRRCDAGVVARGRAAAHRRRAATAQGHGSMARRAVGQRVAAAAPARAGRPWWRSSPPPASYRRTGSTPASSVLESLGARGPGRHARAGSRSPTRLPGRHRRRTGPRDFTAAWLDPTSSAVFAARGGYGTQRMVDLLDWRRLAEAAPEARSSASPTSPRCTRRWRRGSGSSRARPRRDVARRRRPRRAPKRLRRLLMEPEARRRPAARPGRRRWSAARRPASCVGGNLAVLAAEVGTPSSRPAAGGIVVLEDVGEEPVPDRPACSPSSSGRAGSTGCAASSCGAFTDCGDPAEVERRAARPAAAARRPDGARASTSGHTTRPRCRPAGRRRATLDADAGTLTLAAPALA